MDPDLISSIFHSCVLRGGRAQLGEGVVRVDMYVYGVMFYVCVNKVLGIYVCWSWSDQVIIWRFGVWR